jgi:Domain of unknown function (DUF4234)
MTQPAPSSPPPVGKGPIGQPTNTMTVFILTLVTCGIYGLYWMYKQFEELKQHNGEGLGGVVGLILCLFYAGYFLLIAEVQKTYEVDGKQSPVQPLEALWLLVPIYGIYRYFNTVGGALNEYWVSKGAQPVA